MATPPTLVSYTETSWSTTTTPKSTASISWQTGDILVAIGGSDGGTLGTPTATGLTFSVAKSHAGGSTDCGEMIATAIAGSNGSGAISMTLASGLGAWGFGVWVWRGSDGVGNSAITASPSTTQTVSLTSAQADSAIMWGSFDFNEATLRTITPTPSNTRQRVDITGSDTIYVADLTDQPSTGAVSYGTTGTGGTGRFTIGAIEIKGQAASGAMSGSASGHATVSGVIGASGALGGTATGHASDSGTLKGSGALIGACTAHATVSGVLTGAGALIGSSNGHVTATGTMSGIGFMVGAASGHATVFGTIGGGAPAGPAFIRSTRLGLSFPAFR